MISLVALSGTHLELSESALCARLDRIFPGHFVPPRDDAGFVVEGPVPGAQYVIKSTVRGAAGLFMLNDVAGPHPDLAEVREDSADAQLRANAKSATCWLSVDLIGTWTDADEAWRFAGKVIAALAPPDAAVLLRPDTAAVVAFDAQVRRNLAQGKRVL